MDQVNDAVGLLVSDIPVPAKVQEYASTSMELKTKDEIFSAMVVYGFLNYDYGCVSIPNKELMDKFAEMVQKEEALGNVYRLTKESGHKLADLYSLCHDSAEKRLKAYETVLSSTSFFNFSCNACFIMLEPLAYSLASARAFFHKKRYIFLTFLRVFSVPLFSVKY